MAFDFPASPTVGQQFTPVAGTSYVWNGYAWALASSNPGLTLVPRQFTASGPYVPTTNMVFAIIECLGAGGGGGGTAAPGANIGCAGGGGGAGGYSRTLATAAAIGVSKAVTIGAPGTGAVAGANAGNVGGDTSVGSLCIAKGGSGGAGNNAGTFAAPGAGGIAGTGDVTAPGQPGFSYLQASNNWGVGPAGGSTYLGGGGIGFGTVGALVGSNATGYGAGGGGGASFNTNAAVGGGNGSSGIVIILEYVGNQPIVAGGNVMAAGVPSVGQVAEWTSSSAIQGVEGRGRLVLLSSQIVSSAVASVDFTSGIDATYDEYEIHVIGFQPSVNAWLALRFSQDNGATFKAGGTDYGYVYFGFQGSNATSNFGSNGSGMIFIGANDIFVGAEYSGGYRIILYRPSSTTLQKNVSWTGSGNGSTAFWSGAGGGAYLPNTNAVNALRFFPSVAGNITAGIFSLYGIKK